MTKEKKTKNKAFDEELEKVTKIVIQGKRRVDGPKFKEYYVRPVRCESAYCYTIEDYLIAKYYLYIESIELLDTYNNTISLE